MSEWSPGARVKVWRFLEDTAWKYGYVKRPSYFRTYWVEFEDGTEDIILGTDLKPVTEEQAVS